MLYAFRFMGRNPACSQRRPSHHHGALEQLALGEHEVQAAQFDEVTPIEGSDHHRGLGEGVEHGLHGFARQLAALVVVAEGDDLGRFCAGGPKQVDAEAVAIIYLRPELARQLDLARFLVDDGDSDGLGLEHLSDGLAEAAVADNDCAGFGRDLGAVEPLATPLFAPFEPIGKAHQEWRRRHGQGHNRAEQRRRLRRDREGRSSPGRTARSRTHRPG